MEQTEEQTEELVKVMEQFGRPKPLWLTEICWNTHIHPYGTSGLRQANLLVRFHVLALASERIDKVFWWTLKDTGDRQFDQGDMVGLARVVLCRLGPCERRTPVCPWERSPIYILGPKGLKAELRKDPGW